MKNYSHIIWDFNGTLLDDVQLCVEIGNSLLTRRNMPPVSVKWYQENFDFPVIDYYRKIGFDFAEETFENIAAEYINEYNAKRFTCKLQTGALKALKFFHDISIPQSVLSAYQQTSLTQALNFLGITSYFTNIMGLNDFYAGSKIDNGRKLIKTLGQNPGKILIIGDTTHDCHVAQAIGADCLLVCNGHNHKNKLKSCNAKLIDSLAEFFS